MTYAGSTYVGPTPKAQTTTDGTISVGDDPLKQLASEVDWNNLSLFEEYVLAVLDENNLLPEE